MDGFEIFAITFFISSILLWSSSCACLISSSQKMKENSPNGQLTGSGTQIASMVVCFILLLCMGYLTYSHFKKQSN